MEQTKIRLSIIKFQKSEITTDFVRKSLPKKTQQKFDKYKGTVGEKCADLWTISGTGSVYKKLNRVLLKDDEKELEKWMKLIRGKVVFA